MSLASLNWETECSPHPKRNGKVAARKMRHHQNPNSGMFRPRSMTKWERHPARVEHPEESGSCNTNRSCCHPNSLSQSKHTLHCTGLWYRDRRPNRHCGSSCFGGNRFKVSHSSGKQAYILCLERDTSTSLPQPWCVLRSLDEPFWKSSCNSCNPKGKKKRNPSKGLCLYFSMLTQLHVLVCDSMVQRHILDSCWSNASSSRSSRAHGATNAPEGTTTKKTNTAKKQVQSSYCRYIYIII